MVWVEKYGLCKKCCNIIVLRSSQHKYCTECSHKRNVERSREKHRAKAEEIKIVNKYRNEEYNGLSEEEQVIQCFSFALDYLKELGERPVIVNRGTQMYIKD